MATDDNMVITNTTRLRLARDVRQIIKHPLTDHNIYYQHDEQNMLQGTALIIGPEDTPYEGGYYFFKFTFPTNYPHSPPKVEYISVSHTVRLHPNLYANGKVCLSILNTWNGEGWTGCQTISSVLLTICSILTDKPLIHEPGFTETHSHVNYYTEYVRFNNIYLSIINVMKNKYIKTHYKKLYDIALNDFISNFEKKLENCKLSIQKFMSFMKITDVEDMYILNAYTVSRKKNIFYTRLLEQLIKTHDKLK